MTTKDSPALPRPELVPATHPVERLPEEWTEVLSGWGEPAFRGKQIFQWIHNKGVLDPSLMTNLPVGLRERLSEDFAEPIVRLSRAHSASDRTRKHLLAMRDGLEVETVIIPQLKRNKAGEIAPGDVVTQCISSQVGCAMGCVFCASGVAGLTRHLSAAEIVTQLIHGRASLEGEEYLRNVVFMGMGEPLHNYEAVKRALVLMTHPLGLALSYRRITLSTSGLVDVIDRLGSDFSGRVELAISLHAVTNERRSSIMPINDRHPLESLVACLKRYPMNKRQRVTLEYTLIRGVNDDPADAHKLAKLFRGVPIKVNLIPMNPISQSQLSAPSWSGVETFADALRARGLTALVRRERGGDVDAACGQLALYDDDGNKKARTRRLPVTAPEGA